jgi:hypothetical protein
MRVTRDQDRIRLELNTLEAHIFEQVLRAIITHYKMKPAEFDSKAAAAWYSTRGCQTGGMGAEETADWVESLHGMRSARLLSLEEWAAKLAARKTADTELLLSLSEATALMTMLNDYRLLLAAQHDIGQREMDLHTTPDVDDLPLQQQYALCEIDFLGWVIEALLRFIAPEASRWMDT